MTTIWKQNKSYIVWALYGVAIALILAWLAPIIGDQKGSRLVQATVSGILVGGIYALTGLGIVIVTKSSGVFNFAHGFMMVVGGLIFWSFFTTAAIPIPAAFALALFTTAGIFTTTVGESTSDFWRAERQAVIVRFLFWFAKKLSFPQLFRRDVLLKLLIASIVLTALMTVGTGPFLWVHAIVGTLTATILLGLLIEHMTIRPLVGQPLIAMILMTLAVAQVLQGAIQFIWGPLDRTLPIFESIETDLGIPSPIRIDAKEALGGTIIIRTELVFAFILAIVAVIGFYIFFRYAQIGLSMRAVSEDQQLAQSVGLKVRTILSGVWGIAAVLAGIAGVLQGGATSMTPAIAFVALRSFPGVLLGGLDSVEGVLLGGIVVGLVEQWANLLFPGTQAGPELAPYIVLMIVLIVRPEGLFGEKIIERI